jgi:uncharacterized protein (DUF1800 family)
VAVWSTTGGVLRWTLWAMATSSPPSAAIAANRFGLGARPGDLSSIGTDPRAWLAQQLRGGDPALPASIGPLKASWQTLAEIIDLRQERREAKGKPADEAAILAKLPQLMRPVYIDEATARFRAGVATDRPFVERLVHFWTNHFAVSVDKIAVLGLAGAYEREAIRPHVLGRFENLLLAAEKHPAMLLYLDNHLSVGPGSKVARRVARRGKRTLDINENLAREILELHTLGVDGGYTQEDVTTFARVITGWSIGGPVGRLRDGGEKGRFHFRADFHEPGAKRLLGRTYTDDGVKQGEAVLRDLARRPATARFLATKLARHFVSDDPPPALVDRLTHAYMESDGDLPHVYRALVESPEGWSATPAKYKTPSDYLFSIYRGLEVPVPDGRQALAGFELLGQRTYSPGSPAGWPDRSADWDGASALMKRIEWAGAAGERLGSTRDAAALAPQILGDSLSVTTKQAIARAADATQALTLLLTAPEFMRR